MFRNIASGLRALFIKKRAEREMDEELRGYLEAAVDQNIRSGMSPESALRAARVRMGSMEAVKDEVRSAGWESRIEWFWKDIRYGLRMLRKNKGLTTVVVATLALGIGANTAIFSLVDAFLQRSLPVRHPEELVSLKMKGPRQARYETNYTNPIWEQIRDHQDVFAGTFAWSQTRFNLSQGGPVHFVNGMWVSGEFFSTLGVQPEAGRLIVASDDQRGCPGAAVISHSFWKERFGADPRAIGSSISLDNHQYPIIGVTPAGFYGMHTAWKFDVAIPICSAALNDGKDSRLDQRSWWWLNIAARLEPHMDAAQVRSRLAVLSPSIFASAVPAEWDPGDQKEFREYVLDIDPAATGVSYLREEYARPLQILMAVAGIVLLIACANIGGLMLARSAVRRREIAVREALGASRRRIVAQLLTESLLLSAAGSVLGVLLSRWAGDLLVRFISTRNEPVFLDLSLDGRILGFTIAVTLLTTILLGVVPAFRSARVSMPAAMKGGFIPDSERRFTFRTGKFLVATQVAMSLVLLVTSGLFIRSFQKLVTMDMGFDRGSVLLINAAVENTAIPDDRRQPTFCEIETRLRQIPGVVSVGRSYTTPISGGGWNDTIVPDSPNPRHGRDALAFFNFVSSGYFATLHSSLLSGRDFTDRDQRGGPQVAVVNQTLARKFYPGLNPVGRTFKVDVRHDWKNPLVQIVGVVQDSKYLTLREDIQPTVFFPISQMPANRGVETFELRTAANNAAISSAIQSAVAGISKEIAFEFHTLESQVGDSIVRDRLLAMLSTFFGALALLLAMIGLYGTFSYAVTQRQKEFGLRMALGATLRSIARLVLRDVTVVLAGGVAAGITIALLSTGPIQKLLYQLDTRDALTIADAAMLLLAVSLIAAWLPARRASRVDPMVALREE